MERQRRMGQLVITLCMIAILSMYSAITAKAEEAITKVYLSISDDEKVVDENDIYVPIVTVKDELANYYIANLDFDYEWEDDESVKDKRGSISVTIRAKEGYQFDDSKKWRKSNFSISGGEYYKTEDSSWDEIEVILKYKLRGELQEPDDVVWTEDGWASWEAVDGAIYYELKLNGKTIDTKVRDTEYPLYNRVVYDKDNTFKVRAVSFSKKIGKSPWAESDYFNPKEENWSPNNSSHYGPGNSHPSNSGPSGGPGVSHPNANRPNGGPGTSGAGTNQTTSSSSAPSSWMHYTDVYGKTYATDFSGVYYTGWLESKGKWYYFRPERNGEMARNEWLDDGKGIAYAGDNGVAYQNQWAEIEGSLYYFGDNCYKVCDTWLEGIYVDDSGKRVN